VLTSNRRPQDLSYGVVRVWTAVIVELDAEVRHPKKHQTRIRLGAVIRRLDRLVKQEGLVQPGIGGGRLTTATARCRAISHAEETRSRGRAVAGTSPTDPDPTPESVVAVGGRGIADAVTSISQRTGFTGTEKPCQRRQSRDRPPHLDEQTVGPGLAAKAGNGMVLEEPRGSRLAAVTYCPSR
jgi:hypothetical protein